MIDWTRQAESWHDLYLLIGGAAATLMGLTFVAVTLAPSVIAERTSTAVRAFITPIVAFFATDLIVSVVLLIPRFGSNSIAVVLAIIGCTGLFYVPATGAHRQWRELNLGMDDLLWYVAWPVTGYLVLIAAAAGMWLGLSWAPYAAAASAILFLIVAIRNAWDIVIAIARESLQ